MLQDYDTSFRRVYFSRPRLFSSLSPPSFRPFLPLSLPDPLLYLVSCSTCCQVQAVVPYKVNDDKENFVHYLPHRPVIKENRTSKIRPVFDASARTKGSPSLNDCLEKGPNFIEVIPTILNRFRKYKIGVISDIEKAFLQIGVREQDRDFLRFMGAKDFQLKTEVVPSSLPKIGPLTYISEDVNDLSPLTPAMFLQEIEMSNVTDIDCLDHQEINKRGLDMFKLFGNSLGKDLELSTRGSPESKRSITVN
ncbi:integrase catalytic domain-containing protein [Trichonephila clavipes]|nr:integrase catalytic domain-containing protein [Trichonephila clavipes]